MKKNNQKWRKSKEKERMDASSVSNWISISWSQNGHNWKQKVMAKKKTTTKRTQQNMAEKDQPKER